MSFKPLSCVFGNFIFQQRYIVAIMMQLAILNSYHMRVVVNIAMVEMKAPANHSAKVDACPSYEDEFIPEIEGGRYQWTSAQESYILAGFYGGYILTHVPGGWLADKFGARHVMGISVALSSVLTFFYPMCIETNSLLVAVVMRVLLGFLQGPLFPCVSTFIQCWIPPHQRGFLGGVAYGGSNLGAMSGNVFTGLMIHWTNSWKTPFYVWPIFGLIWYLFFLFMVFSRPETHPFITQGELEYLEKEVPKKIKFKVPWRSILTSGPVYALLVASLGQNYLFFTILTYLPKYLNEILKFNIKMNGFYTALPYASVWISTIINAYLADFVTAKNLLSTLNVRRVWTTVGFIIPSLLLIVVVYIGCNRAAAVALFTLLMFTFGPVYSGMRVNINYITIHYGGVVMGIINGLGSLAGLAGPTVVGFFTKTQSLEEWRLVMWIMLGVMIVTTIWYDVFTTTERQPWDFPEETE